MSHTQVVLPYFCCCILRERSLEKERDAAKREVSTHANDAISITWRHGEREREREVNR